MSEEKPKETVDEQGKTNESGVEKDLSNTDVMLRIFTYLANHYGMSFSITLSVGGSLISGMIISRDEYMKSLTGSIRENISKLQDEVKEFLEVAIFEPLIQPIHYKDVAEEIADIKYIHLNDAKVFNAGGKPIPARGGGFLWRGRISSVDGFSIGILEYRGD
ncbi:MAG TPA: gas vesicle accessory protein GvpU [Pyrinomonadaceae bacterium]